MNATIQERKKALREKLRDLDREATEEEVRLLLLADEYDRLHGEAKEAIVKEARQAGIPLEPEDVTVEEVAHRDVKPEKVKQRKGRPKAPFRVVLRETTQVVGRGCIKVAILECGHVQRLGLGGGRGRLRCRQCPEEYE